MEPRVGGCVPRGIGWDMVQTCRTKAPYSAIGHSLATCDICFIFEVQEIVRFSGGLKSLCIPCCECQAMSAGVRMACGVAGYRVTDLS